MKLFKCECGSMFTCDLNVDYKEVKCPNCCNRFAFKSGWTYKENQESIIQAKMTFIDIPDDATIEVKFNI
jgi:hypothetical protein